MQRNISIAFSGIVVLSILMCGGYVLLQAGFDPATTSATQENESCALVIKNQDLSARRDVLFDQSATGLFAFCSSQWDSVYPYYSKIGDNFSLVNDANIDSVVWWGGYWSMQQNDLVDFWIEFFPESTGENQPKQDPIYSQRIGFTEIDLGGYYRYEAGIPQFSATAGETYWITFMATIVFPPHWGNDCSWPGNTPGWGDGQECFFKSDMFGYPQWTIATTALGEPYESSFQLFGTQTSIEEYNHEKPCALKLLQNEPNPYASGQTTIPYATANPGHVSLNIYDATGKVVCVLVDRIESGGIKRIFWNGRDSEGQLATPGVYFYRLEASGVAKTRKMVVVR